MNRIALHRASKSVCCAPLEGTGKRCRGQVLGGHVEHEIVVSPCMQDRLHPRDVPRFAAWIPEETLSSSPMSEQVNSLNASLQVCTVRLHKLPGALPRYN